MARRGFEQFAAALERAWDGGRPEPFAAFERLGKAYLDFARTEPAYYSAMFEAGVPLDTSPELTAAGDRAFAVIRTASETLIARMPAGKRPPALMMALHIWSLSHGIASLFGRGDAGRRKLPMTRRGTAGGRRAGLSARARPRRSRPQLRERRRSRRPLDNGRGLF